MALRTGTPARRRIAGATLDRQGSLADLRHADLRSEHVGDVGFEPEPVQRHQRSGDRIDVVQALEFLDDFRVVLQEADIGEADQHRQYVRNRQRQQDQPGHDFEPPQEHVDT